MKLRLALLLCTIVVWAASAAAQPAKDFDAASQALSARQYDLAIGLFTNVIRGGGLQGETLANAFYNRGLAYEGVNDREKAFADYATFVQLWPNDPDGHSKIAVLGVRTGRYADAQKAMLTLLDKYPEAAKARRSEAVILARFEQLAGRWQAAGDLLARVAALLPDDKPVKLAQARSAASLGRTADALALLRAIDNQYTFVLARADAGFRALWDDPQFLAITDVPAFLAAEETRLRRLTATTPDTLEPLVQWISVLRKLRRPTEALTAGTAAVTNIATYRDRTVWEVWLYDELARSAVQAGDLGRAAQTYRTGADALGSALVATNLLLNAGTFFAQQTDRVQDALDFAARAERVGASSYGTMIAHGIRVATYSATGRDADAARALEPILQTPTDNAEEAITALLVVGRRADAARIVVDELNRPAGVDGMILLLQRVDGAPPPAGAIAKRLADGWEALRADASVNAALAKVGRVTTVAAAARY